MTHGLNFVKKELVFFLFFVLLIVLTVLNPLLIGKFPSFVDWRTIESLAGLMILTNGLKDSGLFERAAVRILNHIHSERLIALFLTGMTAVLSAFLTNDITLFIVVPLTLSLQKILKNDIKRLVVFEAMAANVGSALTPIGNPQNLFLWHQSGVHFGEFILQMLPLELFLILLLTAFVSLEFKNKRLEIHKKEKKEKNSFLIFSSLILMAAFIACMELKLEWIGLIVITGFFLFCFRKIVFSIDWVLLLLFISMFLDFKLLGNMPFIQQIVSGLNFGSARNLFSFSALVSQIISNVPAAILVSGFSDNWKAIAYGVNVGGQGLLIGSLANLIALRLLGDKKAYGYFHLYSVPFFIVSFIGCWLLF